MIFLFVCFLCYFNEFCSVFNAFLDVKNFFYFFSDFHAGDIKERITGNSIGSYLHIDAKYKQ